VIAVWFAIVFTGTYPRGMFAFVEGVIRWNIRVTAYTLTLVTDRYPRSGSPRKRSRPQNRTGRSRSVIGIRAASYECAYAPWTTCAEGPDSAAGVYRLRVHG
jgi:hypothetical protein